MYTYKGKVVHIVDGDTVDLDIDLGFHTWLHKVRIRLEGIDTPECRTRDLEEKVYGMMAKDFVKDSIPVGTEVIVKTNLDEEGKFGRVLGRIFMLDNDTSINQQLLEAHLAVAYEGQSKDEIKAGHLANRALLS